MLDNWYFLQKEKSEESYSEIRIYILLIAVSHSQWRDFYGLTLRSALQRINDAKTVIYNAARKGDTISRVADVVLLLARAVQQRETVRRGLEARVKSVMIAKRW